MLALLQRVRALVAERRPDSQPLLHRFDPLRVQPDAYTLTSIAGIILTVGMAVDANVIIF
jgi:hypothetical protein